MDSTTKRDLYAIASPDGETLVAVGAHGTVVSLGDDASGSTRYWKAEASGTEEDLLAIAACGASSRVDCGSQGTMFAVGRHGTILRRTSDGSRAGSHGSTSSHATPGSWAREGSGVAADLYAVAVVQVAETAEVVAVGQQGTALVRGSAGRWTPHRLLANEDLTAINGAPFVIVGAKGTVLAPAGYWLTGTKKSDARD